jgi:hypothetical protein
MSEDHMMDYMDFDRFVKTYELKLDKEFDHDDVGSSWASTAQGGPSLWGDEFDNFPLNADDPMLEKTEEPHARFSVSPDKRFIAVTMNSVEVTYCGA